MYATHSRPAEAAVAMATSGLTASQKANDLDVTMTAEATATPMTMQITQYHLQARNAQMTLLSDAHPVIQNESASKL